MDKYKFYYFTSKPTLEFANTKMPMGSNPVRIFGINIESLVKWGYYTFRYAILVVVIIWMGITVSQMFSAAYYRLYPESPKITVCDCQMDIGVKLRLDAIQDRLKEQSRDLAVLSSTLGFFSSDMHKGMYNMTIAIADLSSRIRGLR